MTNTFGAKGKLDYHAEGQDAFAKGKARIASPYPRQGVPHETWVKGWDAAAKELRRGKAG